VRTGLGTALGSPGCRSTICCEMLGPSPRSHALVLVGEERVEYARGPFLLGDPGPNLCPDADAVVAQERLDGILPTPVQRLHGIVDEGAFQTWVELGAAADDG